MPSYYKSCTALRNKPLGKDKVTGTTITTIALVEMLMELDKTSFVVTRADTWLCAG